MRKQTRPDIIGKKFNKWTVIKEEPLTCKKGNHYRYTVQCECGEIKILYKSSFVSGNSKQCIKCSQKNRLEDLFGRKFGKFTVVGYPDKEKKSNQPKWKVQCECGNALEISSTYLINGIRNRCRKCTYEDISGQRYGNQVVISRDHKTRKWLVRCDCGQEKLKTASAIKQTKSCGRCEAISYIGKRFGKITVLSICGLHKNNSLFLTKCDCGNEKITSISCITKTNSCGCLRDENKMKSAQAMVGETHGFLKIKRIVGYQENSKRILFLCKCKCGKEKIISRCRLPDIQSCGCLQEIKPKGENHSQSVLKNLEAQCVRELYYSKIYSLEELAEMYSVSKGIIYRIIKRKTYIDC